MCQCKTEIIQQCQLYVWWEIPTNLLTCNFSFYHQHNTNAAFSYFVQLHRAVQSCTTGSNQMRLSLTYPACMLLIYQTHCGSVKFCTARSVCKYIDILRNTMSHCGFVLYKVDDPQRWEEHVLTAPFYSEPSNSGSICVVALCGQDQVVCTDVHQHKQTDSVTVCF